MGKLRLREFQWQSSIYSSNGEAKLQTQVSMFPRQSKVVLALHLKTAFIVYAHFKNSRSI